jgi:hypothetical protein
MSVAAILKDRFSGATSDDPITEADIKKFEKKWKRAVPPVLRELLIEMNGIVFDPEVQFHDMPGVILLSLHGMDSVLRGYGDYAYLFLVPVARSLTHGTFFLDGREKNSEVYHLTPVSEYSPDRIILEKVSINLESFVAELQQKDP